MRARGPGFQQRLFEYWSDLCGDNEPYRNITNVSQESERTDRRVCPLLYIETLTSEGIPEIGGLAPIGPNQSQQPKVENCSLCLRSDQVMRNKSILTLFCSIQT